MIYDKFLARSPKFDETFKETNGDVAIVEHVSPEVFSKVLEYIYTDGIKSLDEHVDEIVYEAVSHGLIGLQKMCEDKLLKQLFVGRNAADVFHIAHRSKCCWNLKSNAFESCL